MSRLHLVEIAEYAGEGVLRGVARYEGEIFVGCDGGSEALYRVEDGGFLPVVLPGIDTGDEVTALAVWDGYLWAAGGQLESDKTFATKFWRYDGLAWSLYGGVSTTGDLGPNPVFASLAGHDGNLYAAVWQAVQTLTEYNSCIFSLHNWAAEVYDEDTGVTYLATHAGNLFGSAYYEAGFNGSRIGLVRGREGYAPQWEDVDGSAVIRSLLCYHDKLCWLTGSGATASTTQHWPTGTYETQTLRYLRQLKPATTATWRCSTLGTYHYAFVWRGSLWLTGELDDSPVYACWDPPRFYLAHSIGWNIQQASADADGLAVLATRPDGTWVVLSEISGGPFLDLLQVEWGDGVGAHKPTLDSLAVEWGNLFPTELYLDRLAVEWGDGLGANKPLLDSLAFTWGDNHALHQPTLERMTLEWYWGPDERPTLDKLTVQWGDGLGANQPTLDKVTLEWGDNSYGPNKPTLDTLEVGWATHEPWPRRSRVQLDLFKLEWADNPQVLVGEKILWLLHTGETDAFEVRVTTEADIPDEAAMRCVIRCDQEALPVLAWSSYQTFAVNESVSIEQPGKEVRIGIVKPDAIDDTTGVLVQLRRETQEE